MLNNYFIGYYGDQVSLFWKAWWFKNYKLLGYTDKLFSPLYGAPYGKYLSEVSHQPIIWGLYYLLSRYFNEILVYNILIILGFLLSLIFSYILFKKFFRRSISLYLSFSYSFSSYYLSQVSNHLDLSQIWVFPPFIILFLKYMRSEKMIDHVFVGLVITFISLISNYYGFFIYLFVILYTLSDLFYGLVIDRKRHIKFVLPGSIISIFMSTCLLFLILKPYFKANYFSQTSLLPERRLRFVKPIEDFVTFSGRPWYYVLPSTRNPIFGSFSSKIIEELEKRNYFLFNNYFSEEHGGNFLGWVTILLALFSIPLYKRTGMKAISKELWFSFVAVLSFIFIFSMPPFFTLGGVKIYTLNFLIFKFFPMFRVTARLSILILLLVLIMSGVSLEYLSKKLKARGFIIAIVFLVLLNTSATYIPVTLTSISDPPKAFLYLRENTPTNSIFAVYPYKKANEALFWMRVHQRGLVNPKDFYASGFESPKFTSKLSSGEGVDEAKKLGVDYLVVFKGFKEEADEFFSKSEKLTIQAEFGDSIVYKIT